MRSGNELANPPSSCHSSLCYFFLNFNDVQNLLQVNKSKMRHRRLRELQAPGPVQWMGLLSERLYVGYQSGFMRHRYLMCFLLSLITYRCTPLILS